MKKSLARWNSNQDSTKSTPWSHELTDQSQKSNVNQATTRREKVGGKLRLFVTSTALAVCLASSSLVAQTTEPGEDETITVTDSPSTWLQEQQNAITIPTGANGVVINNEKGGVISSEQATAIETSASTTINNLGNIFGGFNGVNFVNGLGSGFLDNGRSGVISSDSRAVNIGGVVQLVNDGQILGTGDQRNGTVYSDSVANNFSVDNRGIIDAGAGNQGSGLALEIGPQTTADITNSGLIQGRTNTPGVAGNTGLSGDGLRLANFGATGVFDGTIENSGIIRSESQSGTIAGVRVADGIGFQGSLDNSGEISGVQNGLYFGNADHTGSVVTNSGEITSGSRALNIDGTGLQISNSGDILGTGNQRNGTVYADSTAQDFTLDNSGVIDAGAGNEGAGFSVELSEAGNDFTIDNSGTIAGRGNAGAGATTAGDGIRLERTRVGGALDASTTGLFTGEINNSGTITSEGANGTVGGFRAVNGVSFQGDLNNSGTISGTQNGVYFGNAVGAGGADHTGGVVNNSGVISSDSRAFNIDGTGLQVNNSGDILGTGDQRNGTVYADSTAQLFTLDNSGVIDAGEGNLGAGFSVELSETGNDFTIDNSGTIAGRGDAGAGAATAGDGIRLERTRVGGALDATTTGLFTGQINNSGVISSEGANGTVGGFRAVNGVSFQGELNNSGTISGTQNGVYFGNAVAAGGADHTGGVVNNSGVISSDSRAVNIDGNGLLLDNSGSILATGRQRNGTVYADGTADNFTILNSGSIDARGGAGSAISVQVGSFANDVQNGLIVNSGVVFGSGNQPDDAGIRFFTNDVGTEFDGDIFNLNGGFIGTDDDAAAILVEDGVQFEGSLFNHGTIDGSIFLDDGDIILADTSVLSLDITSLTDFESIETNGAFIADGILDINFVGFDPLAGQTFDLLDFGFTSGDFDLVRSGGVFLDTSDLLVGGSVTVAIPEPSTFALLGLVGMFAAGRRRRAS